MIIKDLTESEIQQALLLPDVNQRKTFYQTIIIDWIAQVGSGILELFTSAGKTYLSVGLIKRYKRKFPQAKINVVVPTNKLVQDWKYNLREFSNIHIYTINAYVLQQLNQAAYTCDMLILDESHNMLGINAMYFNQVINRTVCKRKILLSATLTVEQRSYAEKCGITNCFILPIKVGYRLGVVPSYQTFNIPIDFTEKEKKEYVDLQLEYARYLAPFEQVAGTDGSKLIACCLAGSKLVSYKGKRYTGNELAAKIAAKVNLQPGILINYAINWRTVTGSRMHLLHRAINKVAVAGELLQYFEHDKTLVFCSSTDAADQVAKLSPSGLSYHSKHTKSQRDKKLKQFYEGEYNHLCSVKTLREGLNVEQASVGINLGITSKSKDFVQMLGRLLRPDPNNPDKIALFINLYVDDFEYKGKVIESQEKKWLISQQWKQPFIEWLPSVDALWDELLTLKL